MISSPRLYFLYQTKVELKQKKSRLKTDIVFENTLGSRRIAHRMTLTEIVSNFELRIEFKTADMMHGSQRLIQVVFQSYFHLFSVLQMQWYSGKRFEAIQMKGPYLTSYFFETARRESRSSTARVHWSLTQARASSRCFLSPSHFRGFFSTIQTWLSIRKRGIYIGLKILKKHFQTPRRFKDWTRDSIADVFTHVYFTLWYDKINVHL